MAITVEELQILLSCDATQAEAVLDALTKKVDAAVKRMNGKLNKATESSSGGASKGAGGKSAQKTESYYDKLSKKIEESMNKAEAALQKFNAEGDRVSKVDYGYHIKSVQKLTAELQKMESAADSAFAKLNGDNHAPTPIQAQNSGQKSDYRDPNPNHTPFYETEYGKQRAAEQARDFADFEKWANRDMNGGGTGLDPSKIADGSAIERIQQQLAIANIKVEELQTRMQEAMNSNAGNSTIAKLGSQLATAAAHADKLRAILSGMRDAQAAEAQAQAIAQTKQQLSEAIARAEQLSSAYQGAMLSMQFPKASGIKGELDEALAEVDRLKAELDNMGAPKNDSAGGIKQTGEAAEEATPKVERYNRAMKSGSKGSSIFGKAVSQFGKSVKKHEGVLSKFGNTVKRVVMRMMAMGLVRGVINGITQGMQILGNASSKAQAQFGKFTAMGNSVKAALGSVALSVLNALSGVLYNIASAAITAANAVSRFFAALGGGTYFAVGLADSFENIESAAGGAGGAVKGMLADFDELNVIGQNGGGGGGGGANIGNTSVTEQTAYSKLAELFKNGEWFEAGQYVGDALGNISTKISKFFTDLDAKNYGSKFAKFINGVFSDKSKFEKAGKAVGDGANLVIHFLDQALNGFDGKQAGKSLAAGVNSAVKTIDWASAGRVISGGVNTLFGLAYGFFKEFDARGVAKSLTISINEAIHTMDWNLQGKTLAAGLLDVIEFAVNFVKDIDWAGTIQALFDMGRGIVEEILSNPVKLLRILKDFAVGVVKTLGGVVVGLIAGFLDAILGPFNSLLPEKWQNIGDKIVGLWNGTLDTLDSKADAALDSMEKSLKNAGIVADDTGGKIGSAFDSARRKLDSATDSAGKLKSGIDKLPTSKSLTYTLNVKGGTSSGSTGVSISSAKITSNISLAMAKGGIAYGETFARIGEYAGAKRDPEVVSPLSNLTTILKKAGVGGESSKEVAELVKETKEQHRLLRVIAAKELKISPSAELGQTVKRSEELYGAV